MLFSSMIGMPGFWTGIQQRFLCACSNPARDKPEVGHALGLVTSEASFVAEVPMSLGLFTEGPEAGCE